MRADLAFAIGDRVRMCSTSGRTYREMLVVDVWTHDGLVTVAWRDGDVRELRVPPMCLRRVESEAA